MTLKGAAWRGVCLAMLAGPALAEPHFNAQDRAILGRVIRQLLAAEPEIVARALSPYGEEAARDRSTLDDLAPAMADAERERIGNGTTEIALIYDPASPRWESLRAELEALVAAHPRVVFVLHPLPEARAMMDALELDVTPSYVFPDMILRGDVPVAILPRYF